eukprot:CAMPEP_0184873826 /NCGR_PEP_ID=MMETSP0580-20130426/42051_1 /TAXON_ID=1118495 /ORGANISM="Dactyliosolen fragilissimus" /LENGTH=571 /DNA_ID=CAMNT_0027376765 /DNA_START=303 /DNA_END=2018 /DNA_ORIENTATION=+
MIVMKQQKNLNVHAMEFHSLKSFRTLKGFRSHILCIWFYVTFIFCLVGPLCASSSAAPKTISTSDVQTLRSLGMIDSDIYSIGGAVEENLRRDNGGENAFLEKDAKSKEENENTDGKPEVDFSDIDEKATWRSDEEWWRDPLAHFEDEVESEDIEESDSDMYDLKEDDGEFSEEIYEYEYDTEEDEDLDKTGQQEYLPIEEESFKNNKLGIPDIDSTLDQGLHSKDYSDLSSELSDKRNKKSIEKTGSREKKKSGVLNLSPISAKMTISAPALPALLIPKISKAILSSHPAFRVLLTLVAGNFIRRLYLDLKIRQENEILESDTDQNKFQNESRAYEGIDDDYLSDGEIDRLEELGFGRSHSDKQMKDIHEDRPLGDDHIAVKKKGVWFMNLWGAKGKDTAKGTQKNKFNDSIDMKDLNELAPSDESKSNLKHKIFNKQSSGQMRTLEEEINSLRELVQSFQQEKLNLENDNENIRRLLKNTQSQMESLSTSNSHLKAQLIENENSIDEAIKFERQKSRDELSRVREAMVSVLEHERAIMREELERQANEIRAMMSENKDIYVEESSSPGE